jgi:hypothetical protein
MIGIQSWPETLTWTHSEAFEDPMTVNGASSPIFAGALRRAGGFARFAYYYRYFAAPAETV